MDVEEWLRGLGLEQYATSLHDHAVDGALLTRLTSDDLKDLGVVLVGHRRKLLEAIAALREAQSAARTDLTEGPKFAPPEADRRQLTVLCCDLVGSTELNARLDPEDMSELLRGVLHTVAASVVRFGGYVARYMGDGALIFFGYPQAHEDDAEQAVRAGLDLVEKVRTVGQERGIELNVRVGIATSSVVVGEQFGQGPAQEQPVTGEAPYLASRLQAVAQPNRVVIASATRKLAGNLFDFEALDPQMLKGFAEPVRAWAVLREKPHTIRFEASRSEGITPLIGRKHELSIMFDRWRAVREGEAQVLLLSGEPGIGKSRLARALWEKLRGPRCIPVRYQCSAHHANQPFFPAMGQIWHASGFSHGESAGARLDKLEAVVAQSHLDPGRTIPCLAALFSIPTNGRYPTLDLPPSEIKARTIETLIALLAGLSDRAPVFFLLEDAHWIDPTTVELISRGFRELRHRRVFSLITFRPEFIPPWSGADNVTSLSLNRLGRAETLALIDTLTDGKALPGEVLDLIIQKTDGVPIFIEELTKTVIGSGFVREQDGQFVAEDQAPIFAIPSTLHDSLMARLDRLAPIKEIAQIGAAIGREFSYRLMAAVAPMSSGDLQDALAQLVASELISVRGGPQDPVYTFKHALIQDTAYSSLLRSRRSRIHAEIAGALAAQFADRIESAPEIIAHHYSEAGLAEPAVRHWLKAAELALSRSANTEGARYAETGVKLIERLPEGTDRRELELALHVARANAALALKGYTAAETIEILSLVKRLLESGIGSDM
ncbi:MAG: AAA family ATPase, partial [Anaerolineaceae bacterium]